MRVIGREEQPLSVAAGAFQRRVGVSADVAGAQHLWSALVELAPGAVSQPHHHAECESSIYMLEGEARFYSGDRLDQCVDASAGDFILVPAHEVHVEQNRSQTRALRMIVTRSPGDVVVHVPAPEGWAPETDPL